MEYPLSDREYQNFRTLIYDTCGISLGDNKKSLIVSRLSKRLRDLGLTQFQQYYELVAADPSGDEFTKMLDLVSTNKTDFFREPKHFDYLREQILPEQRATKSIRIWSSASSTGEEPYTIAMTLYDHVDSPSQWNMQILATDISTRVLAKASAGIYDEDRVRDMAPDLVSRHFLRGKGEQAGLIRVKPHLAQMIQFRRLNLMDDQFPIKQPLDLIFCRNVMIYFDRPTQERLVAKFFRYLRPGGHLFIGHSESLQWIDHSFDSIAPTIYRKAA
ncbi:MAG: protein-glutamate O-methyltransferase [Nitrospiraceae bacterium]